jgi:methylenetetrahydrofolate dehydrogenase (NADP+) / methenyltetrahydrofolate cyclohydrolase
MTARILDGKALAGTLQSQIRDQVAEFIEEEGVVPRLAAVLVGDNPASEVYVRNKRLACERVGIDSQLHRLPTQTSQDELLALIGRLNMSRSGRRGGNGHDAQTHRILVQLPLPPQIDASRVLQAVSPLKDVDAFHPENVGLLVQGRPRFLPCTPFGIQQLLVRNGVEIQGKHVVVVGRSDIVGKPLANMLLQRGAGADATVTVCHSRTTDLPAITRQADVLIVAIGKANFLTAYMVKPGAVVVDVGMNRIDGKLCGDVDYTAVREIASWITPVPGGVGPLTVTMLLVNTLKAAELDTRGE